MGSIGRGQGHGHGHGHSGQGQGQGQGQRNKPFSLRILEVAREVLRSEWLFSVLFLFSSCCSLIDIVVFFLLIFFSFLRTSILHVCMYTSICMYVCLCLCIVCVRD